MRGIYKITNTNNGKCYIGKSEHLENRLKYHLKSLPAGSNKNKHMQNAYNKYECGTFTIEILEFLEENDDINSREKYWIKYYQANDREHGYNKTDGGDGGNSYKKYLSEEELIRIRKKQSERMTNEGNPNYHKHCFTDGNKIKYITDDEIETYLNNGWIPGVPDDVKEREKIANAGEKNGFFGKKHSNETKQKISDSRKGEKNWNYGKIIIHKEEQQKYVSIEEIDKYLKNGWIRGMRPEIKNKISKKNTGRKSNSQQNKAIKYMYDNEIYFGWRKMQAYLKENGYPKISEAAITKLAQGKHVRGYDDLFQQITII